MKKLDALFEGGHYGTGAVDQFNDNKLYYDAAGNVVYNPAKDRDRLDPGAATQNTNGPAVRYNPRTGQPITNPNGGGRPNGNVVAYNPRAGGSPHGGGNVSNGPTEMSFLDELKQRAKDGLLFTKRGNAQGFDNDFYKQRRDAYLEFANPEVDTQYGDANKQLTFALSRAGTLDSSTAADRFAKTEQQYSDARRRIADAADDQASQARQAVGNERSHLTQLVQATGDPSASLAGVGDILTSLRTNPVYDPVGPVFQNVTAGVGNYMQGQRYADMQRRLGDLFRTPGDSSGRIVN
jgi:hypothetical protein